MKKIFGFRSKKGMPSFDSSISPGRDRGHHRTNFQPRNHIRDKDLGEIHKAASVGDVAKVQQVLLLGKSGLNDKDKLDRTALHLACANGHPAVVALLLERKCLLNLCDSENRTALMKAVECQEEECATLLLEQGTDPNVRDACGNTALHYAVLCQNSSLAAKLLSYNACIEARNKDDLTPLLVAIRERRGHMVEFLVKKEANIHAVDKMKRTALMLAVKYESENVVRLLLQQGVDIFSQDVFGWTAEEYAVISGFNMFPNKPGVDLGPTSNDESISESLPQKYVDHLPGASGQRGKKTLNGQVEDLSRELDLEMITKEEQDKLDEDENNHSQVEEEKKHKSSEVEVSDNVCDAANEKGLIEQRRSGGNSNQEFPAMQNEDSYRPARITPHEKKKVKEQINYVNDLDDLTQSSETVSEDGDMLYSTISTLQVEPLDMGCKDFGSLLKIRDAIFSYEILVDFQRSHCELLRGKIYKMKSKVRGLQKELSETKEVKSQLEHQKVEWELELGSLRFALKQEEEKRRNTNMSCEKIREQLRRVEDEHSKEIEMKQQLEFSLRALEMELRTVRNNWNQTSAGHEEAKDLLRKNHILQEEIASLRLEIDAVKSQNLEKERNYFEDIEIVKAKSDDAQKVVKLTEEMLTKTISQDTGQPNVLAAANMMLKSKLENKKESKQRLETEVKSYRSKLVAASHDPDRGQTSPRDLELAFQRAKDEWLCLQDKMESDVANLKDNSKALSQQLSTVEHKFNKLKIKLQHTRHDLREKTLTLDRVQRDLHQAECQKQEAEHMYRNEQGKVKEHLGKQESLEERLSQLQSENMLLRQQLDDAQNKADSKEKTVIGIQDQFQQIVRKLHAESEKQGLMLEERNKELISERNHLKERLQAESQQVELRIKDLESELSKMKTLQEDNKAEFETYKHLYLVEFEVRKSLQDELDKTNERLAEMSTKLEVEKQQKRSLLSTPSSTPVLEPSSVGNFNPTSGFNANLISRANVGFSTSIRRHSNDSMETYLTKIDDRPAELETVCSQCLHMNAKIQVLREELLFMTGMQKKCEELEKNNKKLEQKIVNLKSHIEMNMTEHSQVEQYKQEIEERARQELVEKLKEVNTVLQIQAASQENLEQAQEEHIASFRSQMELRMKELESEVFKMETSEADLEKYKKLYLEELKVRKSLEKKLDKTNWRLAEMSTELEVEKQQNRSLLSTLTPRPVLEPPSQKKFP
ncbi:hypothetical protein G4228_015153 [Cervus hanglu yarkandensis]|nr:hypothetical protein G4228_015153 [Cervus hanglu yarkandensis]